MRSFLLIVFIGAVLFTSGWMMRDILDLKEEIRDKKPEWVVVLSKDYRTRTISAQDSLGIEWSIQDQSWAYRDYGVGDTLSLRNY